MDSDLLPLMGKCWTCETSSSWHPPLFDLFATPECFATLECLKVLETKELNSNRLTTVALLHASTHVKSLKGNNPMAT
jgi:hypothetical protein